MVELPEGELIRCDQDRNPDPSGFWATVEGMGDDLVGVGRIFLAHDVYLRYSDVCEEFGATKQL
jgi:hypothetical protein